MTPTKKRTSTFIDQEKVISKSWISAEDIMILAPLSFANARKVVKEIQSEMKSKGEPYFDYRPAVVPTNKVLKYLGFKAEYIRKEAQAMRNALAPASN